MPTPKTKLVNGQRIDIATGQPYQDPSSTPAPVVAPAPTNVGAETPAGALGSAPSKGLGGNLRQALQNALNEAGSRRMQNRLTQINPYMGTALSGEGKGGLEGVLSLVRAGVQSDVGDVYGNTLKQYSEQLEAERKAIEFNPEQYRSVDGGIYDLKNNRWVVGRKPSGDSDTVGTGLALVGGNKVLAETKQVIDGFASIEEMTPTQQQKVKNDLYALGYADDKTPDWFTKQLQEERRQSLMPDFVQQEWNTHRNLTLYGKKLSGEFFRNLYKPKDLEKLAKKDDTDVDTYINGLDKTIQLWRDAGFTDKEIFNKMSE